MISVASLYTYSSRVRRRFLERLAEMPWDEVSANREASHHSIAGIMVHMIDNEDWIVNWVIHNRSAEYKRPRRPEEYTSVKMLTEHADEVERRTGAYLQTAGSQELQRAVKFTLSSGATFDMTVEESLFQSFTEQLYHIGEIIALLWQHDVEPPKMQWFHNRENIRLTGSAGA